ncbi:MAG TPA: hypothetical protein VK705_11875 [Ferruginibacter sp.]|nr:hypothetical protein [Ferruginibacter sp.]
MSLRINIFLIIILMMFLFSCSKDRYASINISKPSNGEVFTAPEVIQVIATLSDGDALGCERLTVTKQNGANDTVINFSDNQQIASYTFNKNFVSESNTTYKIIVSACAEGVLTGDTIFVHAN